MSYPTDDPIVIEDNLSLNPSQYSGLTATQLEQRLALPPAQFSIQTTAFGASLGGEPTLQQRMMASTLFERPLRLSIDTRSLDDNGRMSSWGVNMRRCEHILLGRNQDSLHIVLSWDNNEGNWVCSSTSHNNTPNARS